jgi:hypothetical protein
VRRPIELKLSGDLRLVSQISVHLKLGWDIWTSTRNSKVRLFCYFILLFTFCKRKQRKHTLWIIWPSASQIF